MSSCMHALLLLKTLMNETCDGLVEISALFGGGCGRRHEKALVLPVSEWL